MIAVVHQKQNALFFFNTETSVSTRNLLKIEFFRHREKAFI